MSRSDIDCMGCLVNVARGLEVEGNLRIYRDGVNHAAVWSMGLRLVVACKYEQHNTYSSRVEWRRKRTT